jgi:uncharacterized protein (DUF2141 family)
MKAILVLMGFFTFEAWTMNLEVQFQGLSSSKGQILYLLFDSEEGFPDEADKSVRQGALKTTEARSNGLKLEDLKPGTYAFTAFHDENLNNKLDTNFLGIPKESFGFSNNPKIFFGPPSFEKASIEVLEDSQIIIEMKGF